jgi:MATE family multidrug resistance protein
MINNRVLQKRILMLAWPVIMEMALHTAVWVIDTAMVGRLNAEALNAVGLGGQIIFTVTSIFAGVGVGAMVLVARYTGANRKEDMNSAASQGLGIGIVVGIALAMILGCGSRPLLAFFVGDEKVLELGIDYMRITSVSAAFMVPLNVASSIMRGMGNTKTPMIIASIANIINIVGDYVLIFGRFGFPRLEVTGAAIATAAGQIIASIIIVGILMSGRSGVRICMADMFRLSGSMIRRIIRLSIPASLEEFTHSGSRVISSLWITSMGPAAFAANSVAVSAESISFMPGYGFAVAASTLVGQNLGARNSDEAEESAVMSTLMGFVLMTIVGLMFFFFPAIIISVFTNLPEVMEMATKCLRVGAFEQPFIALSMIMGSSLRGAGDTRGAFIIAAVSNWMVRLPLVYVVVYVLRLDVTYVWAVTLVQFMVESGLLTYRFLRREWKDIDLERD